MSITLKKNENNLVYQQLLTLTLLTFCGFMKLSEVSRTSCCDIHFYEIFILRPS